MAFRWRQPGLVGGEGKVGAWRATRDQAMADAVSASMSGRSLSVSIEPEFVPALFQSLSRAGWYIEEGKP